MIEDQICSLKEPLRNAYQNIVQPEVKYVRKETIDLERTADKDPWFPSEQTGRLIHGHHKIEIILIDEQIDIVKVHQDLVRCIDIGLVLMGPEISRRQKPHLIVLTTEEKYYVIDPNDVKRGITMLTKLLKEPEVSIWTTNGLYEADCLFHHYGIKLEGSRAKCCTGLHVHLMRVLKPFPYNADKMLAMYPMRALEASRRPNMRLESYENLASIWLDAKHVDLSSDTNQFIHLQTRPLDLTAINLIKKRCCLVLSLARELRYYSNIELGAMNKNILHSLTYTKELQRKILREEIKRCESRGIASIQYYAHLNGVFANPKPVSTGKIACKIQR